MTDLSWALPMVIAATPLLLAATGELVVERSGVLNLGVEGAMLLGAVASVAACLHTGSLSLGLLGGAMAGLVLVQVHSVMVLGFAASQVGSGLALSLLGAGLSSVLGTPLVGQPLPPSVQGLSPWWGLVGGSVLLASVAIFLRASRFGLILRAVGEGHGSAHALGHPVRLVRALAISFGGATAGAAGAFLALVAVGSWSEGMTDGRGWIALALVVFAGWRAGLILVGALLFGGLSILELHLQTVEGLNVPSQALTALPYALTLLVLAVMSVVGDGRGFRPPAMLGRPFRPPR